jgi:predicted nucleotide-binding protein (sugar kinase/HSP70/actin superfamily)
MKHVAELLKGRCLFIPQMGGSSVRAFVAAFKSAGIEASAVPPSDHKTLELSGRHVSGDECYPLRVVLGDFLKAVENFGPDRVAFFMPTTCGPCRFGQYAPYMRKLLQKLGYDGVPVLSPSSSNGYDGMTGGSSFLLRTCWRAIMASDTLQRMLLRIRPYEQNPGESDSVYAHCLEDLCRVLQHSGISAGTQLKMLTASLERSRDLLRSVPVIEKNLPLIGVVGEIFCRLNEFSNQDIIRCIESQGAECWLSGITEWLAYANLGHREHLINAGKKYSPAMGKAKIKSWIQHRDEQALLKPFLCDLPEEAHVDAIVDRSRPYLPHYGVIGEMGERSVRDYRHQPLFLHERYRQPGGVSAGKRRA